MRSSELPLSAAAILGDSVNKVGLDEQLENNNKGGVSERLLMLDKFQPSL